MQAVGGHRGGWVQAVGVGVRGEVQGVGIVGWGWVQGWVLGVGARGGWYLEGGWWI